MSKKTKSSSSKSPKGSKKGKAGKSGKAGGKKKGQVVEPPKDAAVDTTVYFVCCICGETFCDAADLQAHCFLMDHNVQNYNLTQRCRLCGHVGKVLRVGTHRCCKHKAWVFRHHAAGLLKYGPPMCCLFCRSRRFDCRTDLLIHLLAFHRPHREPGTCGLCQFKFTEPPPLNVILPPAPKETTEEVLKAYAIECKNAREDAMCGFENAELSEGEVELDRHCKEAHHDTFAHANFGSCVVLNKRHL